MRTQTLLQSTGSSVLPRGPASVLRVGAEQARGAASRPSQTREARVPAAAPCEPPAHLQRGDHVRARRATVCTAPTRTISREDQRAHAQCQAWTAASPRCSSGTSSRATSWRCRRLRVLLLRGGRNAHRLALLNQTSAKKRAGESASAAARTASSARARPARRHGNPAVTTNARSYRAMRPTSG
jgi:hypothetical protein